MKSLIFLLLPLCSSDIFSQTKIIEKPANAIVDDSLQVNFYYRESLQYYDQRIYLVNDGYAVYEDGTARIIFSIDTKSFRLPKWSPGSGFAMDKNGVYCKGKLVRTDTTGFVILSRDEPLFWKTKSKVFKDTLEVTGVDAESFVSAGSGSYYKDKNHVYHFDRVIEGADPATFDNGAHGYFDKNNIYNYNTAEVVYHDGERLIPVNYHLAKTSKEILISSTNYYNTNKEDIAAMDVASLEPLTRYLAMDRNHVYYGTQIVFKKETKHGQHLIKTWDQVNSVYVSDGKHIYDRSGNRLSEFDAPTFGLLAASDFEYDKNGIYDQHYDYEKESLIWTKLPFNYSEPVTEENTFSLHSAFIIYNDQAYDLAKKKLTRLTPEQISSLRSGGRFQNNDLLTNRIHIDHNFYKTNDGVWLNDNKTIADAATFERIGYSNLFKDKQNVYYRDWKKGLIILEGVDPGTAQPYNSFVRDKEFLYWGKNRIISSKKIEILAIFPGYRAGCGQDTTPGSDFYLLKNRKGYWLARVSNKVTLRYLGKAPGKKWHHKLPPDFKIK